MQRPLLRALLAMAGAVLVLFFALPLLLKPAQFAALRGWLPSHDGTLRALGVCALALAAGALLGAQKPEANRGVLVVLIVAAIGAGALGIFSITARAGTLWVAVDTALFLIGGAAIAFLFPREAPASADPPR
jgi:hypothetical protein